MSCTMDECYLGVVSPGVDCPTMWGRASVWPTAHVLCLPSQLCTPRPAAEVLHLGVMPPKGHREPRRQQVRQRLKIQALQRLDEIEAEALGTLRMVHKAMVWRRNQRVWLRLRITSPWRMLTEVVTFARLCADTALLLTDHSRQARYALLQQARLIQLAQDTAKAYRIKTALY